VGQRRPEDASQNILPLTLTAAEAAASLRVSLRQWWRLDAMGKVPAAVRVGRAKRWRADELKTWLEHGCPDRITWRSIYACAIQPFRLK
jgi:hypothetical protein